MWPLAAIPLRWLHLSRASGHEVHCNSKNITDRQLGPSFRCFHYCDFKVKPGNTGFTTSWLVMFCQNDDGQNGICPFAFLRFFLSFSLSKSTTPFWNIEPDLSFWKTNNLQDSSENTFRQVTEIQMKQHVYWQIEILCFLHNHFSSSSLSSSM